MRSSFFHLQSERSRLQDPIDQESHGLVLDLVEAAVLPGLVDSMDEVGPESDSPHARHAGNEDLSWEEVRVGGLKYIGNDVETLCRR